MLILSRRPGDAIVIAGDIRIVVLGVDARGVRLGIEAPASVGIVREEILQEIAAENRRAAAQAPPEWLHQPGTGSSAGSTTLMTSPASATSTPSALKSGEAA